MSPQSGCGSNLISKHTQGGCTSNHLYFKLLIPFSFDFPENGPAGEKWVSVACSPAVLVSIGSAAVDAVSGFDGNAIGTALNGPAAEEHGDNGINRYTCVPDHAAAAGKAAAGHPIPPNAVNKANNQMQTVAAGGGQAALLPSRGSVW